MRYQLRVRSRRQSDAVMQQLTTADNDADTMNQTSRKASCLINPLKGRGVNWLHLAIQV